MVQRKGNNLHGARKKDWANGLDIPLASGFISVKFF